MALYGLIVRLNGRRGVGGEGLLSHGGDYPGPIWYRYSCGMCVAIAGQASSAYEYGGEVVQDIPSSDVSGIFECGLFRGKDVSTPNFGNRTISAIVIMNVQRTLSAIFQQLHDNCHVAIDLPSLESNAPKWL